MGSRRIFTPQFKLQVLDSYRNDSDCKGNQRATARKYGIHRRQIQKWLQAENSLRSVAANGSSGSTSTNNSLKLSLSAASHHHPLHHHHQTQLSQTQFQIHHHHHHHQHPIQHQNPLNSIELKVPLDSTRHRVAPNASNSSSGSNNNSSNSNIGKESSASACIISPVPTHTVPVSPSFSHPHETSLSSPSSSASLSVLKPHNRDQLGATRANFSPVAAVGGDFPAAHSYERLNLLDPYYHPYSAAAYAKYAIDCPIDLSLPPTFRKVDQALSPCSIASSSVYSSSRPPSSAPSTTKFEEQSTPHPTADEGDCSGEAVDLSCRKRKTSSSSTTPEEEGASPPKSFKLFKPYLLDDGKDFEKDSSLGSPTTSEGDSSKEYPVLAGRPEYPIIYTFHAPPNHRYYESLYEYNGGPPYSYPSSPPYLAAQPPFGTLSPSPPAPWIPPQASPVSGYDSSTSISSVNSTDGHDDGYSFEIRQQAIDCFYHDASCRGDFRAVASKYNINRKYIEKWLSQGDPSPATPPVIVR